MNESVCQSVSESVSGSASKSVSKWVGSVSKVSPFSKWLSGYMDDCGSNASIIVMSLHDFTIRCC